MRNHLPLGIALLASVGFASSVIAKPVRIMPLGDSLTQNSPGYRGFLHQELREANYDVDFVGSNKDQSDSDVDLDNEGHGGFTIGPGPSKADEWTGGKGNIYVNVDRYLKNDPEIILLMIGTNEYFNIGKLQPDYKPDVTGAEKVAALVDRIHELKPDLTVLVASVPPVAWDPNFAQGLNNALPALLEKRKNTIFVNMSKECGFETGDWSSDKLHPSESGFRKIAQVWFRALEPILKKSERKS